MNLPKVIWIWNGLRPDARGVAYTLAKRGNRICLVGDDEEQLKRAANDLTIRANTEVLWHCDCFQTPKQVKFFFQKLRFRHTPLDGFVVAPYAKESSTDLERKWNREFVFPYIWMVEALNYLKTLGGGSLAFLPIEGATLHNKVQKEAFRTYLRELQKTLPKAYSITDLIEETQREGTFSSGCERGIGLANQLEKWSKKGTRAQIIQTWKTVVEKIKAGP